MTRDRKAGTPSSDRRARREAQRAQRRADRDAATVRAARGKGLPPVLLVTIAAIVLGLGVVAFVALQHGDQAPIVAPSSAVAIPRDLAHDRAIGDADAPVTLDVWSDFQCPACLAFWRSVNPQLVKSYVATGKVRIVYHDFIIIGPESTDAAVAARCANEQGSADFWLYHDYLYANQGAENSGAFSRDRLIAMAKMAGLDTGTFQTCLDDPSVAQAVQAETAQGQRLGIHGTPTLMIGSQMLPSFDEPTVAKALDAALAKAGVTASPSPGSTASPSPSSTSGPGAGSSSGSSSRASSSP